MKEKEKATKTRTTTKATKKPTVKKGSTNKNNAKKVSAKKSNSVKKATSTNKKKTPTSKTVTKKTPTKKVEVKGASKKTTAKPKTQIKDRIIEQVEVNKIEKKEAKDQKLENTIIFDGTQSENIKEVVDKLSEDNVVLKNKVIKRNPQNKYIIIALSIIIALVIVSCTSYVIYSAIKDKNNNEQTNNIYDKINTAKSTTDQENNKKENQKTESTSQASEEIQYSNIKTISLETFQSKLNAKDSMLVLISSETCYYCITFEPVANEVLKNANKEIYRLDITTMTDEQTNKLREIYAFKATPTTLSYKEGNLVSEVQGYQEESEFTNWVKNNA